MAVLDPRYVTTVSLEEYFVNNGTGAPNAFGTIWFWEDNNRNVPKNVFQLVNLAAPNTPPNYAYVALPNPITLSAVGTPVDNNGNNVAIYYFPYDGAGNVQLYFVQVFDSFGTLQEQREGWPNTTPRDNPDQTQANLTNELQNSQFVDIFFNQTNPLIIPFTGAATTAVQIAPNWALQVTYTANTQVTVTRTSIAGTSGFPFNPPYTLTIAPGANINGISLIQTLTNNPNIFAPAIGGVNGWLSGSVLLAPGSSLMMFYMPNGQPNQLILAANNTTGVYTQFNATVQLAPVNNPSTSDVGFVNIILSLPIAAPTTFSNVQIVGLDSNIPGIGYDQQTANMQRSELFNYYNPVLSYKPIKSYLIGWDFPLNPTQVLGPTIAASAAGANSCIYTWDQTILFQTVNNGAATSQAPSGAMRITATNATQFAIVQYLPAFLANEILNNPLSMNLAALTPQAGGLVGTMSIWYTNNANLPSTAANATFFNGLDVNGVPTGIAAGWNQVTRNGLGNAQFLVGNSATTNFNNYGFIGWNLNGAAAVNTATFIAVVIGFATLNLAGTIDIQSGSLVPGSIPTIPGPQSEAEVLVDCQPFYEKSFNPAVIPQQNIANFTSGCTLFPLPTFSRAGQPFYIFPHIQFKVTKNVVPITMTLYNPSVANAQMRNIETATDFVGTTTQYVSQNGFNVSVTGNAPGSSNGDQSAVYWSADARLGL